MKKKVSKKEERLEATEDDFESEIEDLDLEPFEE